MKKVFLFLLVALSFVAICGCSSVDDSLITKKDVSLCGYQFDELKKISSYHTIGLDEGFDVYNSRLLNSGKTNFSKKEIHTIVSDFGKRTIPVSKSETRSVLKSDNILSDTIVVQLSNEAEVLLNVFVDSLLHSESAESMELYIRNLMETESFASLDSREQPYLVFMMLIGIDSAKYWSDPANFEKWEKLVNNTPTIQTRGAAGPGASYWINQDQMNERFRKTLWGDIRGCGYSGITFSALGWAVGGIAGSIEANL